MIFDGKLYLNLEKQVQKNKDDIEYLINEEGALNQFGLRVVGQVESVADMPTVQAYKESNPKWEYGDAFMAGVSTEEATVVDVEDATLLVLTRANTVYPNDFWMNLGKFPKPGPTGATGATGPQGPQGEHGLNVETYTTDPTGKVLPVGTTWLNATTGDVFVILANGAYTKMGNIRGATGATGPAGVQGKTGPIGPTGAQGPQGPRGIGVNILGTLTSTSQLPDPTTVAKDSAYIIPADGVNHLWVIEGTTTLVWTDFGTAGLGEKGDKGDDGVGIDTMTDLDLTYGNTTVTYDTTDGMAINGQARFTYNGGTTKDVTMDIEVPIVAGDGVTIDKVNGQEKVEVGLDFANLNSRYYNIGDLTSGSGICALENYTPKMLYPIHGAFEWIPTYETIEALFVFADEQQNMDYNTSEPDSDYYAINVKYARDKLVAKHSEATPTHQAYAKNPNGTQSMFNMARTTADANTIAVRDVGGALVVGTPTGLSHATTKAYVDAQTTYTHYITITNENYDGMLLLTFPAKIEEPIEDFTQLADKLAEIGKPITATGYLHNNSGTSASAHTVTIYGIEYDSIEQVIKALVTYQTSTLTDQTITTTTTSSTITIQEDGLWSFTDVVA